MRKIHPEILAPKVGHRGYLCFEETVMETKHVIDEKLFPMAINYPDVIKYKNGRPVGYLEHTMLRLVYLNDLSIWDILIR